MAAGGHDRVDAMMFEFVLISPLFTLRDVPYNSPFIASLSWLKTIPISCLLVNLRCGLYMQRGSLAFAMERVAKIY